MVPHGTGELTLCASLDELPVHSSDRKYETPQNSPLPLPPWQENRIVSKQKREKEAPLVFYVVLFHDLVAFLGMVFLTIQSSLFKKSN